MKKNLPEIHESACEVKELLKAEKDSRKKHHLPRFPASPLQALSLLKSQLAKTRKQVVQTMGVHRDTGGRWLASQESQSLQGILHVYKAKGQEPRLSPEILNPLKAHLADP